VSELIRADQEQRVNVCILCTQRPLEVRIDSFSQGEVVAADAISEFTNEGWCWRGEDLVEWHGP